VIATQEEPNVRERIKAGPGSFNGLRPLSFGAAMEDRRCPRCSSDEVLRVVYGLPSEEMIEESIAGRVLLGGCVVWPEAPDWQCVVCGHEWRGDEARL
jgi:hypothetical protein